MSITSYERLRITHRTLLRQPPSEGALRDLLAELPAHLNDIASIRPALEAEVDYSRQQVQRIQECLTPGRLATTKPLALGLHAALAPLFAG
ncbi:hypothetical protein I2I05_18760 [Hymenobacter sp. BT683]|uniref:Uncharacterized protein n=1 Tax=Hymenobacter jeongseonensis TaxID=2791027 RepID=A0ABS0IM85_9BACT|nr:hypothetical protein [Hymenobacter jeongseonensis]MBF9239441.1 hypothetical protein [Hymenobacter jeongseonensis]